MSYVSPEDIALAKEMDLLTYLQNYEPQNLKRVARSTYCTREHDSLKISNGKWHWFSRGVGGKTALDYLIKVKDIPFIEAVETILGRAAVKPPVFSQAEGRKAARAAAAGFERYCRPRDTVSQRARHSPGYHRLLSEKQAAV